MPIDRLLNNRYRLLKRLGEGGFGTTLLAEDTHLPSRRCCVIKQLKPQIEGPGVYALIQQRFDREAVILEELGAVSASIPQLYAYFSEDQQFYLVQEWVEGPTLTQLIRRQGPLGEAAVRGLLARLLQTLDYVHGRQVIHRDIKPDNILLRARDGQPVLIDFGIAKELVSMTASGAAGTAGATSIIIGTPGFMPPEQLQGRPTYATDLYSLGLTAIYLLTGRMPQDFPMAVESGAVQWRSSAPSMSEGFAQLLDRAIQAHAVDRYPTAQAMLLALQALDADSSSTLDDLKALNALNTLEPQDQTRPLSPPTLQQASVPGPEDPVLATTVFSAEAMPTPRPIPLRSSRSVRPAIPGSHQHSHQYSHRDRTVLLNKVRNYWVKGVLERSLHHQSRLLLGLQDRIDAVEHPWRYIWTRTPGLQPGPAQVPQQNSPDQTCLPKGARVIDQFDQLGEGRTLLILGEPGSGKTITLLELAQVLLDRAQGDPDHPIPVVFNLSSWAIFRPQRSAIPLASWLIQELKTKYQVSADIGKAWIQEQALLLLLDGLDEVRLDRRNACVEAINQFSQDYGQTEMIVCSRKLDYEALNRQLRFQGAIALQPLSLSQVQDYLYRISPTLAPARAALQTDMALQDLVRSPLMLSIFVLAYQQASLSTFPQQDLAAQRQHLFRAYVDRMLGTGKMQQRYTPAQMRHWLRWLAKGMVQKSQTIFLIEQLQPDWLLVKGQRWRYAAGVGVLGGLIIGVICGVNIELIFRNGVGLFSGLMGVVSGILVGLLLGTLVPQIEPVETLRWSWPKAKANLGSGFRIGGLVGLIMGLGSGLIAWYIGGPADVLWQSLLYGLSGLGTGLIFILLRGLSGPVVEAGNRTNQGMWQSARNALGFMGIGTVSLGTLGSFLGLPPLFGVFVGVLFGCFSPAGLACLQHLMLRTVLAQDGCMPWNYGRFLDELAQLALLQKVGGGYIFIHRLLLEYLAEDLGGPP